MQIVINKSFLYKIRPERMIFIAILFWLFCFVSAPIKHNAHFSYVPMLYIGACLLFFLLGTSSIKYTRNLDNYSIEIDDLILSKIYRVTFVLGALGIAFKYYDILFLRHAVSLFSEDNALDIEQGGNFFSIMSGLLIYFSYIPVTIDQICSRFHNKNVTTLSHIMYFMTALMAIITGSRFAIIIPVVYFILLLLYAEKLSFKLTLKNIAIFLSLFLFVGIVVGGLFLRRLEIQGQDGASVAATGKGYAKLVPISDPYKKLMKDNKGNKVYYTYLFAYSNIVQYELHALYEFPNVMRAIEKKGEYFYGQATFQVYMKFINKLIGSNYDLTSNLRKHNLRPGIWSTFFFEWFLDFGWVGIVLMFFMGLISKLVWRKVFDGYIFCLPLSLFISIIWLLVLNLNMISGGGSYAIFSFTMLPLFTNRQTRQSSLSCR